MSFAKKLKETKKVNKFPKFDKIDGSHPLKAALPNGFIDYSARKRSGGSVKYFNYDLAREMGLIPATHDNVLTKDLEQKFLDTFAIQIINEYDLQEKRTFPSSEIKPGKYMATRYLQLQHGNKQGKSSGDGRSIWNGQITHKSMTWDISSCGTGATQLSPATSKYNRYFETGDPTISYGCGYAEVDEGLATSLLSKVFSSNNIKTEQTLGVIEFENNLSINIRAHRNLLRPSHFFLYLKQNDLTSLRAIVNYYINQECLTREWEDCPKNLSKRYDYFLKKINNTFAYTAAKFEDEYIFCWLDWDGDNILMDGSIIDYGSIRQFGIFHHEYRYDDVERYSTNILEQKGKARYIIQAFTQLVDYIKTGEKKKIATFTKSSTLKDFDSLFENYKDQNLLKRIGFSEKKTKQILRRFPENIQEFRKAFSYFEKIKSLAGKVELADGVTCDAVFNMRTFLREYPQLYMCLGQELEDEDFMSLIKSQFALKKDLNINTYRKRQIKTLQKNYLQLVKRTASLFQMSEAQLLSELTMRSQVINKANRITGDSATHIISELVERKVSECELYQLVEDITVNQNLIPEKTVHYKNKGDLATLESIFDLIHEHREGL